jgi:hypothetical protein
VTATFNYDAFGGAIGFTPSSSTPIFLFGGDAVFDYVSGLYMNGDGDRDRFGFRFIQKDSFIGITREPLSLNSYLYADANSPNTSDPTGAVSLEDGKLIHTAIEQIYQDDFEGHTIAREEPIPGSFGLLYPDIVDYTLGQVAEIKPLTSYGIATGPVQLFAYLDFLNGVPFTYNGRKWIVLTPVANDTGGPWAPSSWNVGVQYVPVPGVSDYVFTIGNAGGVIYYSTVSSIGFNLDEARAIANNLAEELNPVPAPAFSTLGIGTTIAVQQQSIFQLNFTLSQNAIPQIRSALEYGSAVGLAAALGIATLNSTMGAPV